MAPPPRFALSTKTTMAKSRRKSFLVRSSVTRTAEDRAAPEDLKLAAKVVAGTLKTADRDAQDLAEKAIAVTTVAQVHPTATLVVPKTVAADPSPSAALTTVGMIAVIGAEVRRSSGVMGIVLTMAVPDRVVTTSAATTAASKVPIAMPVVLTTAAQRDADAMKAIRKTAAIGVEAKISVAMSAAPKATVPIPDLVLNSGIAMAIADLAETSDPNPAAKCAVPTEIGIARGTNAARIVDPIATMIVIVAQTVDSIATKTADLGLVRIK